ncbi:MAG: DUF4988 domain-containing protein [Bacteroidaceae bacterium]|nr:DUF4988 domain-containing protein [Bacteroidaceae bacterium]
MKYKGILAFMIAVATYCFVSCDKYSDDLQGLGKRVEALEDSCLDFTDRMETITSLLEAVEANGIISDIQYNADGSCTLYFTDDREPITFVCGTDGTDGVDGEDGKSAGEILGVKQAANGKYYWTFNGTWLLDEDGNMVPAEPTDGEDGTDGKDADPAAGEIVLPQIRINIYGIWEISNDGGKTWSSTGVSADGKSGSNGQDGAEDPVVKSATVTNTEVILIVYLNNKVVTLIIPRA